MVEQQSASQKVYPHVVNAVLQLIKDRGLQRDDPLPTQDEMVAEFGAGRGAVKRALQDLRAAGVIYSVRGRGSFVRNPEASAADAAATIAALEEQVRSLNDRTQAIEELLRTHLPEMNMREAAVT